MATNDWQNIENTFHHALALSGTERVRYISQACAENESMRSEIESLLTSFEKENDFLEETAFDLGMKVLESNLDVSLTGREIGFYKIFDKLGSGGMGDVYLAEDTRLNRKVALKFLSNTLVDDRWAKKQLFKEAQAVAGIDHPNVCRVYGIEEIGEHSFIVMQHIEGSTLSNLIRNGQIQERQFLPIAQQITAALAAAHENGIIHRDVKAGNIMMLPNGEIRVLDFGLAKIIKNQTADNFGETPSLLSQTNAVVGTVAYMSPEQLRGEKLDFRTDIFSLGTVFYELLSGGNPFLHNSDAETMAAILTADPKPISGLKNGPAADFNRLIKKCLEKDKEKRFQTVAELASELQNLQNKRPSKAILPLGSRLLLAVVLLVVLLTVGTFVYRRAVAPRSLAVLPFVNLSQDAKNDFIGGMAETLISKLSDSSQINVKPYTMVSNYKITDVDPVQVGQNLNVDAVLTGKIITRNNQLILETNLINIADGNELWSEKSILNDFDTLNIQNVISEKIIAKLQSPLNAGDNKPKTSQYTENPEAYKFYLQGLEYWRTRDKPNNIARASDAFNQAIRIDPNYARAYAGLAYVYIVRSSVNYKAMPPSEAIVIAKSHAETAIKLDETLSEPHAALGAIYHKYDWNWAAAEKEYQRALELNSEIAQTYSWYADFLAVTNRSDDALRNGLKAKELDPFSPIMDVNVGRILYYARRFDEAEDYLLNSLKNNPNNSNVKLILGFVYLQQSSPVKHEAATKFFEELYEADKKGYAASLGFLYGKLGKRAEALDVLKQLEEFEKQDDYLPAHEKALVYIGLQDKEKALFWLEKAYQERFMGLPALNVDPIYDGLRSDARFQQILVQMNSEKEF